MMNKIFIAAITGIILMAVLTAGCGKTNRSPTTTETANPQATTSIPTPAAPISPSTVPNPVPPATTPEATQSTTSSASDILQDSIPLKVTVPADASDISSDTIAVEGQTVPGASVSVNDTTGTADANGNFSVTISLAPGPNAIDVIATDSNGKEGEVLILVNEVSSGSPTTSGTQTQSGTPQGTLPLKVIQPADAATLNTDTVAVTGQTEAGATVIVNNQIVTADNNGNFNISVSLVPGPNAIDVVAQDDNGNQNEVIVMVNVIS